MREAHNEISGLGARIVAIGTGDRRYAEAFVREEQIPYLVLVDDDAAGAGRVGAQWITRRVSDVVS